MEYDDAVAAYSKMLELDPLNVDAYLGLAEVHIRNNEYEEAYNIAKKGYDLTGDERLKNLMDMIESGNIFASNGWTMKDTAYDADGSLLFSHEYSYDLKGRAASITWRDGDGKVKDIGYYEYDDKDRKIVDYESAFPDGYIFRVEYSWTGNSFRKITYRPDGTEWSAIDGIVDNDGRTLEITSYESDGSIDSRHLYEYDDEGRPMKVTTYNKNGEVKKYVTFEYDSNGNQTKLCSFDGDGNLKEYRTYEYDENGKLIQITIYNADGSVQYVQKLK